VSAGEAVLAIDGHDVTDRRCYLAEALLQVPPGTKLELTLAEGRTVTVTAR
jgi:hypothetical protein